MPEEQGFRPQRRPIDPSEVAAAENQAKLNEITQIRKQAAEEVGQEVAMPMHNPNVPITGNIPSFLLNQQQNKGPRPRSFDPNVGDTGFETEVVSGNGSEAYQNLIDKISKSIYEEIELPSKGKFYNGSDGPRDGKLHIRPMTGKEEEILATSRYVKKGQAMNMIFNKCIKEDYNTEEFLTEDRTYLLIYLRGISYTPQYDVEVKCPGCDRRFNHVINLNDLYVDACPDDFNKASLSDTTPATGIPFTYRLSRGEDEQQVQDYRERKGRENVGTDDTLLYRSALLLENFGGCTSKKELIQLLKQLHINDVAHIRNTVSEPPFGVDTNVDIYCPGCLEEFTIDLPLEADFFFPRKRKKEKTE